MVSKEITYSDLAQRFRGVARNRDVRVSEIPNDLLALDYRVSYDKNNDRYEVEFTTAGHFEEAYCFIERWINRHAQKMDNVYSDPPASHLDLRDYTWYWMTERVSNQFIEDLRMSAKRQIEHLKLFRPNEGSFGAVTVEARISALQSFLENLAFVEAELHSAILSPRAVTFLQSLGINLLKDNSSIG